MRFQLWRKTSQRPTKTTGGTYAKVGQVVARTASPWIVRLTKRELKLLGGDHDEWGGLDLDVGSSTPVVPGDLLVSAGTQKKYKVMEVALNVSDIGPRDRWAVRARTVQQYERFAKHRDYQQCSRKQKKR